MTRWLLCLLPLLQACAHTTPPPSADECVHALDEAERAAGWTLLFDGSDLAQWRGYKADTPGEGWTVQSGCLAHVASSGDLITRARFADFELKLDWRISAGGNSGIFLRGDEQGPTMHWSGFEMQVLDNARHPDAAYPSHRAGAYYDMIAPDHDTTRPAGTWNAVHITVRGDDVVFRLNGRETARFRLGSSAWQALLQQSKFTDRPRYGTLNEGHIGLQDHGDAVWYRNIRVRRL